jgi:hypothetical protein
MSSDGSRQTALASSGQIYVSTDFGNTWTAKESSRSWNDVAMSSDGSIQTAAPTSAQIYVSTDFGNTWTAKDSSRVWNGIAMSSDGSRQTAVFNGGQIYVSIATSTTQNIGMLSANNTFAGQLSSISLTTQTLTVSGVPSSFIILTDSTGKGWKFGTNTSGVLTALGAA